MTINGIKTRKPTGQPPWPTILLEGESKAGKSYAAAQLSASTRVGDTYWIDLDEGAADEYGAIPGARYQVIEHDGSYAQVLAAVKAVKAEAERARDAGEPPVVLVIDTISAVWDKLKDWTSERAKKSRTNQAKLREDPNAELTISSNLWNDAGNRWGALTTPLLTFPGIVVLISRGKEVMAVDDNGRPIEGRKEWRVEVRKNFEYSPSVWIRMRREEGASLIGARSLHIGLVPGEDRPRKIPEQFARERLLEWLVFDALQIDPAGASPRDLAEFHGGELLEHEKPVPAQPERAATRQTRQAPAAQSATPKPAAAQPVPVRATGGQDAGELADVVALIEAAVDDEKLREVWALANRSGLLTSDVETSGGSYTVGELIQAQHEKLAVGGPAKKVPAKNGVTPPAKNGTAQAADPLLAASAVPDPVEECRSSAARRGVFASLDSLGMGTDQVAARFGRPVEQIATKRLSALVRHLIAEARAKVDA